MKRPERPWALGFDVREVFDDGIPQTCFYRSGIAPIGPI
jgi:hypothetical protein